jgi:hypothetical protein
MTKWGLSIIPSQKPEKSEALRMILPGETRDLEKLRISYGLRNFQMF